MILVCALTFFNPVGGGDGVNLEHLSIGLGIFVFVAGMIAISAMVLPGISGSTLLLIMGLSIFRSLRRSRIFFTLISRRFRLSFCLAAEY